MGNLPRFGLSIGAAALFAGCGGHGVSGALPGSAFTAAKPGVTLPDATSSKDLLYVTKNHSVFIYSYPQGKQVDKIYGYYGENAEGECADSSGNVYVVDDSLVTSGNTFIREYARTGKMPIRQFFDHLIFDQTCSVDPASGYLTATAADVLTIWHASTKHRRRLHFPQYFVGDACSYDDQGNVFVGGSDRRNKLHFGLVELPKGSHTFVDIALPRMHRTNEFGGIRWDGTYLAFSDGVDKIYRLAISGTKARIAGTVDLDGASRVSSIWIQGSTVVGGGYIWNYPAGGKSIATIKAGDSPGVAVSVPPTR